MGVLRSVSECLEAYEREDTSTGYSMKCRECEVRPEVVSKRVLVLRAPRILILRIDRDLRKSQSAQYGQGKSDRLVEYAIEDDLEYKGASFRLFGVVLHHGGTTDYGHYTASVRSLRDKQWYHMDDSTKRKIYQIKPDQDASVLLYHCPDGPHSKL